MRSRSFPCLRRLVAFAVFVLTLGVGPINAVGFEDAKAPVSSADTADERSKKGKKAEQRFQAGLQAARGLIRQGQYEAGITALHSLRRDTNSDVACYLGYASSKLRRYNDARFWYEEAVTADPRNARAWSYFGIWHAEEGNALKALEYLEKVRAICGPESPEYRELEEVIARTHSY